MMKEQSGDKGMGGWKQQQKKNPPKTPKQDKQQKENKGMKLTVSPIL